ncbi:MAG: tyrosine-type recombinase/integrase [Chloroflexi bacterium]|nr:tyrosine-type recombinase/integrase [Chloroflexota bacterium]
MRGRGHITRRSKNKNTWSIVLDLGRDPATGKRRRQWVTVRGTKRDAERKLVELLRQLDTGGFVEPSKITVGEFLKQWLRDYAKTAVRPRTFQRYENIVQKRIIPVIGAVPLTTLKPQHVQAMYSAHLTGPRLDHRLGTLSAKTVVQHHRVLREALAYAMRLGLVARNVADAVDPPTAARHEVEFLDADAINTFLDRARNTPYYALFHLDIHTGLRRSELLGLRWKDVDLDLAALSVRQAMHRLRGGQTVFLEPKTSKGRRQVALSPSAVLVLRSHREKAEADNALLGSSLTRDSLVFSLVDGSPMSPDGVSRAFKRIAKHAGFPGVRLHDLRHSHASLMLKQGVHPKIVQERLGHATIAITLDVYSHVTPGLQEAAAQAFDAGLHRATELRQVTPTRKVG